MIWNKQVIKTPALLLFPTMLMKFAIVAATNLPIKRQESKRWKERARLGDDDKSFSFIDSACYCWCCRYYKN